ncbi:MAG: AmmeMemoRadiSam system protein B, partial [Gammaproteobacteria bacterium]
AHDLPHRFEHCLEVQLPFLQRVLTDFSVVPVVVGETPAEEVAAIIQRVWGAAGTLLIVSSDLSHYHGYEVARQRDRQTADAILGLEPRLTGEDACGCYAVNGLLLFAREHGKRAELLCLKNSGDTAGDKSRVVGYGAFAFFDAT